MIISIIVEKIQIEVFQNKSEAFNIFYLQFCVSWQACDFFF